MKKILITSLLALSTSVFAGATPHWMYEGKSGPDNWGELSNEFITCKTGKFQSPIDIVHPFSAELPPLELNFNTVAEKLVNNGHTLQVTANDEDEFRLDDQNFILRQYHFHTPSENRINGKSFPLEAHFVHASKEGDIAVLAVMFEVGPENSALTPLLTRLPKEKNHEVSIDKRFDLRPLFPADLHYYRFSGSLTTPPCTEGLRWIVMKNTVTLSKEQLEMFKQALGHSNNRPLQPLNGRVIVQ